MGRPFGSRNKMSTETVGNEKAEKGPRATGQTRTIGEGADAVEVPTFVDSFKFTVPPADKIKPEQASNAGKSYTKEFTYAQAETDEQAAQIAKVREWTLLDFVNEALRSNARSSAYQAESGIYALGGMTAEDTKDRLVKDYMRLGIPEEVARQQVDAVLSAMKD